MKTPPPIPRHFTLLEWSIIGIVVLCIIGYFTYPSAYKWVQSVAASDLMREVQVLKGQLADVQKKLLQTETERDKALAEIKKMKEDPTKAEQPSHNEAGRNPEEVSTTPKTESLTPAPAEDWKEKYDKLEKEFSREVSKLQREKWVLQDEVNRLKEKYEKKLP